LYIAKKYEELKETHKNWPDRLNTVEEAYQFKLKEEGSDVEKSSDGKKDEL